LTAEDTDAPIEMIAESLDEEATVVLQELLDEHGGTDRAEETITASINALLAREISNRLAEIDRLLPLASSDEKDDLIREKKRLAAEIQSLGRPRWKNFNSTRA
jgi:ribosome biogenesis SPOUT family RNA methylase Rps3